jgi:hypothetical protein
MPVYYCGWVIRSPNMRRVAWPVRPCSDAEQCRRPLRLNPALVQPRLFLGEALLRLGKKDEAKRELEQVIAECPKAYTYADEAREFLKEIP